MSFRLQNYEFYPTLAILIYVDCLPAVELLPPTFCSWFDKMRIIGLKKSTPSTLVPQNLLVPRLLVNLSLVPCLLVPCLLVLLLPRLVLLLPHPLPTKTPENRLIGFPGVEGFPHPEEESDDRSISPQTSFRCGYRYQVSDGRSLP